MTDGVDAAVAAFRALDPDGQRRAHEKITDILALAQSVGDTEADHFIGQLRLAAVEMDVDPSDLTADLYRAASKEIRARGEHHEPVSADALYEDYLTYLDENE